MFNRDVCFPVSIKKVFGTNTLLWAVLEYSSQNIRFDNSKKFLLLCLGSPLSCVTMQPYVSALMNPQNPMQLQSSSMFQQGQPIQNAKLF